jgi:hypothetical protein
MTTFDVIFVIGALLATIAIPSLFPLASLRGAGPRSRAAILRYLGLGWAVAITGIAWLILGWFAIEAGSRWFGLYRDVTLVLMGCSMVLLVMSIRMSNRTLALAHAADQGSQS